METDATQESLADVRHPTLAQLKNPDDHPDVDEHLKSCSMCQSVVRSEQGAFDSVPIPLDLPKGLVSESAFKWPADPIARGGMAQIFAGEDRRLGRTVILKAPRDGDELAPGMADMFQRRVTAEARVLAKLQHPAIVTIYELGKSTVGWPFCVLEKVEGTALRDRLDELTELEQDGKPRTRERLELLSNLVAIAEALAYAHERRVVHRDCTPNNILLGKRGEATLIDWGIARDLDAPSGSEPMLGGDSPSTSGRMVTISAGTPPYLPLEQTQGRQADPSFDVYSFGITLYEVIAGRPPFEWKYLEDNKERSRQLATFLEWLKSDEPAAPAMPKDPELSGIIARAMARDAESRFTADELVRALKQYLTGDLVFSHRYSIIGRLSRWARTHKAAMVVMASVLVLVVGGALVWAQLARQERDKAQLQATATAAVADRDKKQATAEAAQRDAEAARAAAEDAQKRGENSEELRKKAEEKRKAAERAKGEAQSAAEAARGTAEEANTKFAEAMKAKSEAVAARTTAETDRDLAKASQAEAEALRDAAKAAQQHAETDRDAARSSQSAAEQARDAAKAAQTAAETDRDAARQGQTRSEQDRDAARAAQVAAESERDAARAAQAAAERERDELNRQLHDPTTPPPLPSPSPSPSP